MRQSSSACGILFCYNEEKILAETLKHYLAQGIDLVIFDNYSTDSSVDIIQGFEENNPHLQGRVLELIRIITEGYQWQKILRSACDYMHKNLSNYRWILTIDADAFYCSPVKSWPLLRFMESAASCGYNILNGSVYEFYPTEKDDPSIASPAERIKYYQIVNQGKQHKIFLYHPTVDFFTQYGHVCIRDNPKICEHPRFIYKHYPWVSYEHGLVKIFNQRRPRYIERQLYPDRHLHWHYMALLPVRKDLVKDFRKLRFYNGEDVFLQPFQFFLIGKLVVLKYFWRICVRISAYPLSLLAKVVKKLARLMLPEYFFKKIYILRTYFNNTLKRLRTKPHTESYALTSPGAYHFLMANYCNAQCIFCNQKLDCQPKKEIALESFKTMISNIPVKSARNFYFSGGGEPLLCRGLFKIIEYVNNCFPWIRVNIRTNGLLIGKYAEQLAQRDISRLEISVHGTAGINDIILQRKSSHDIFEGIALLNDRLKRCNKKIYKAFYPVVSRINIGEVPELIKKAAQLGVDEVAVFFCRYYELAGHTAPPQLKTGDSLYFHKELYNEVLLKSIKLAKSLGIKFYCEPLFFKKIKQTSCCQPWQAMVVDWDGDVYPCAGGEVWFDTKVKSGEYYFGNLLKESLYQFWNNASYIKIRRTCIPEYKDRFIPECVNCHNTVCFMGSDIKEGHILQGPPESGGRDYES